LRIADWRIADFRITRVGSGEHGPADAQVVSRGRAARRPLAPVSDSCWPRSRDPASRRRAPGRGRSTSWWRER